MTADRTYELMQAHLDSDSYDMMSAQESAPDRDALLKLASELCCRFPEEFLIHSTNKYGGLYVEVKEHLWPRPKEFDVGPFWAFSYGMYVYGLGCNVPEFMDLRIQG